VIDNEKYGLFLDMGLGKTVSTLTAFSELQLLDTKKMLVIAPKQVAKDTWVDEVDKWNHLNHLKVSLVLGYFLYWLHRYQPLCLMHHFFL
jgi:SNF2 family DNA or RNA helicase